MKAKIVIIGAGQAGIACAEHLRKLNSKVKITVIDQEADAFYYRAAMKYFVKGALKERGLIGRTAAYFKDQKIKLITDQVKKISPETQEVIFESEKPRPYDYLLIATGASPFIPPIPGTELESVYPMRTLQDTKVILETTDRNPSGTFIVVGGGVLGMELADALKDRHPKATIHLFAIEDRLGVHLFDTKAADLMKAAFEAKGIQVHLQTEIQEILGTTQVESVRTNASKIECTGVFLCTGVRPNISLAKKIGLEVNRGILVDAYLKTSNRHIYAAGDVAEFYDSKLEEHRLVQLWAPAGEMGLIVAQNILADAAQLKPYNLGALHIYTVLCGKNYHAIGNYAPANPKNYEILSQVDDAGNYIKFVLKADLIVGAVILGEAKAPIVLKRIIEQEIPIASQYKNALLTRDFDYELILYSRPA